MSTSVVEKIVLKYLTEHFKMPRASKVYVGRTTSKCYSIVNYLKLR